jgi:hypothetical protein
MDIIKIAHKGKTLDALERFFIYKTSKSKPMINEQFKTNSNVLFDLIIERETDKTKMNRLVRVFNTRL